MRSNGSYETSKLITGSYEQWEAAKSKLTRKRNISFGAILAIIILTHSFVG